MAHYDLLIRGATLVTPDGPIQADLALTDERIAALGPSLEGSATAEIAAAGLHLFPGVVDAHVHCDEPGRTAWEGFASGTRALAAGGATAFCDMPLNAHPPTIDAAAFDLKLAAARAASLVDFALWGGLVPGNIPRLAELAARGVIGYKAFMASSGIEDFIAADDLTLYEGMAEAARLGLPVAVHAENDALTRALAARAIAQGRTSIRDYLASRPVVAELEAISRAILFAQETGCALHIVHVSTGQGVQLVAEARARGVDVSCETCPHYLVLTEEDAEALGAIAKCAPPLRPPVERDALWRHLADGTLPMVASDHSPAPPELKRAANFFHIWGGISGCQSLLSLLLTAGHADRGLALERIAALTADYPARRFGLARKGRLAVGADADLALVDLSATAVLRARDLFYRHPQSPYIGRT
ncbi:MAG: allantoinase AllB, partial [Ktedonobacterales bacterium]|nr:allantoinase AllB [Ktedonobacterales bacterium]